MRGKKAVEWISTVLYVLIGLAIIASLLAIIQPEVSRLKDRFIISQTIQSLDTLDDTIMRAREATGTRLNYIINLEEGTLLIDGAHDKVYWNIISDYKYSEVNKTVEIGKIKATTLGYGKIWNVTLELGYSAYNINLTVSSKDSNKYLTKSSLPYSIWIENRGKQGTNQQIDFSM